MTNEIIDAANEVTNKAIDEIRDYFRATEEQGTHQKVDHALTWLGRANSMESTRLKSIALKLQAAKMIGLRGEELRPLIAELIASGAARAKSQETLAAEESTVKGESEAGKQQSRNKNANRSQTQP